MKDITKRNYYKNSENANEMTDHTAVRDNTKKAHCKNNPLEDNNTNII